MPQTAQDIQSHTGDEPLTMLTAYDAPTAELIDTAGVDMILVGDSMGNATLGYETTLPVTIEDIASSTGAVARAADDALVIADMPFLSIGVDRAESIRHCGRLIKEEGADAVKLEAGPHTVELTAELVELGIPVMAHLGLTPQRVKELGGYTKQGVKQEQADRIHELAVKHEQAGAFALVLEHVPAALAAEITADLSIPTIGIGAGPETDGQVLVINDVIGLSDRSPPFATQFGDVRGEMRNAIEGYVDAVSSGQFPPTDDHDEQS